MKRALIVVDLQNDFLPGGALAVGDGDAVIPFIVGLIEEGEYPLLVVSQDYHPKGHGSFASVHPGASPFQMGELAGLPQMLWPDHCVEGTAGAELEPRFEAVVKEVGEKGQQLVLIKKGLDPAIDSYSAFFDNGRGHDTGLHACLKEHGVEGLDVVGLALDYCVKATALDGASLGFDTRVLLQGTRAVDPSSEPKVLAELSQAKVTWVP